jgi:hypothetical protein
MRALSLCLVLLLALPQCGGGGSAEPKTAADDDSTESSASTDGSDSEGQPADETTADVDASRGPSCDDGTCSVCGPGICPAGWYCDESAPGGAACAWLKECAEKATCGCVTKVLGTACKCRDESGIKVSCN